MTEEELNLLEEILNDELIEYLDSGFLVNEDCVIQVRNILKKLGLKEYCDYDWRFKDNE